MKMEFSFSAIMIFTLFEDNNGTLGLVTSPRKTPRTRHISVKYHLFREHYGEEKGIMIHSVESKEKKADVFTNGLPSETFYYIRKLLTGR